MRSSVMPGASLVLLGLLGCEPTPLDRPSPPPVTEQSAVLHFVQGAFALPKVELLIDKQPYATLDYRQAKGGISLSAGEHEVQLRAPGGGSTLSSLAAAGSEPASGSSSGSSASAASSGYWSMALLASSVSGA